MKVVETSQFQYVQEETQFFKLFPHRYDYIWAEHCSDGNVAWQTESRHPLSDRLIEQGASLYGVRFGPETKYCLIDIDVGSQYHPNCDPQAMPRMLEALEPLGLVSYIACTSSYSGGIHLYFPFEQAQKTWKVAIALRTLLENAGFTIALGQLELFPNTKPYVADGDPSLYSAHRLPLQVGSYLLNEEFQPIYTNKGKFVSHWLFAQFRNAVAGAEIERLLKAARRQKFGLSGKADKFLNDLNVEIELGWSGPGQTNYILGRIAMRSYIFGHILYASLPLEGKALVDDIVRVATSLPGYHQWCRHQHEIEQRAEEWARSVEASHYFHFRYRSKKRTQDPTPDLEPPSLSWNQRQQEEARNRIRGAIADLLDQDSLPSNATARFHALVGYGIGGSSLYRHRDLWHPTHLQPVENPPNPPQHLTVCGRESIGDASLPQDSPSLFEVTGGNPAPDEDFSAIAAAQILHSGRNSVNGLQYDGGLTSDDSEDTPTQPSKSRLQSIQMLLQGRDMKTTTQTPEINPGGMGDRAIAHQQKYVERMRGYLESGDPILMKEALQALRFEHPASQGIEEPVII